MRRLRRQDGNAMVEFVYLSVLLMVPLVYVLTSAFQVQRAAFGVTEGARQAARAYVTSSDSSAEGRAREAAALALSDQGVTEPPKTEITCSPGCRTPGATVTVTVRHVVRLPVFSLLGTLAPVIPVSATHDGVVDEFQGAR